MQQPVTQIACVGARSGPRALRYAPSVAASLCDDLRPTSLHPAPVRVDRARVVAIHHSSFSHGALAVSASAPKTCEAWSPLPWLV